MKITLFLADDHTLLREGLRLLLETQSDLEVVGEAANGREAVSQVTKLCPHIVILDIRMPELNGIEAARQIHEFCPASRVIILSADTTADHIFHAFQAGVRGYVIKEVAGEELIHAVRTVWAGERYLQIRT